MPIILGILGIIGLCFSASVAATTFELRYIDSAGTGFLDTTPADPLPGSSRTTQYLEPIL